MNRAEILGDVLDKLIGIGKGEGVQLHRVFTLAGAIGPYLAELTRDRTGGVYHKLVFTEDGSEYITTPDGGPDLPAVETEAERAANIVVRNPVMLSQALFETAALNGELPVYSQPPDKPDQHKFHGYAPANTPENEVAAMFLASNWQSTIKEAKVRTINGIRQWRLVVVDWKDPS